MEFNNQSIELWTNVHVVDAEYCTDVTSLLQAGSALFTKAINRSLGAANLYECKSGYVWNRTTSAGVQATFYPNLTCVINTADTKKGVWKYESEENDYLPPSTVRCRSKLNLLNNKFCISFVLNQFCIHSKEIIQT